jgi:diguanylate cyclase (GGDEF)-like protein
MRIRTKIYISYSIVLGILFIAGSLHWYTRHTILRDTDETRHVAYEIEHINDLSLSVLQLLMPANDYLSTGNKTEKEKFVELDAKVTQILGTVNKEIPHDMEIHRILKENVRKIEDFSNKILSLGNPVGSHVGDIMMYEMDKIGNQTVEFIREYNNKQHEELDALYARSGHNIKIINIVTILGGLILVLSGLAMVYYFNENFKKPIEKLNRGFRGVSHGRWNHVALDQNDELSDLAREFNSMIERMSSSYEELENEVRARTTELSELNKRLEALAITDGLSGLYNHRYFYERYHQEYNRALRYNRYLSLFMIDIDHFKQYNDTNGHLAGDKVISKVAKILLNESRKSDIVCRYGGEEFVIISPELDEKQALAFAEKLREAVEKFKFTNEHSQPKGSVSVSIGIGVFPGISTGPETLLKKTDEAMYQAKRAGRNRSVLGKPTKKKTVKKK